MELNEDQVWIYRENENSQYSKWLVIDYVNNPYFSCHEMMCGKCTSHSCHDFDYLLDDERWRLLNTDEICELLSKQSEYVRIINESGEYERKLITKYEFAEQEVKKKKKKNAFVKSCKLDLHRSKMNFTQNAKNESRSRKTHSA